ncbi:MAG: transcription termination factor NusA [bacterium]|nr:transcription termination factor NusA [bacterium]
MATNAELAAVVNYLERDRGVDREVILQAIESSVEQAARRNTNVSSDFTVRIDRKTLELQAWDIFAVSDEEHGIGILTVEQARRFDPNANEGDTVKVPIPAARLGRIAAQTARQTITQKIREAERANVYNEYKDRVGEIVTGAVKLIARKDLFVELGKTEALLPAKERIPSEEYVVGDVVRAYVLRVQNEQSGPAVTLSRACPDFVRALFRLEVAEIADGEVEVMSIARDPGRRSKVAVRALAPHIDPVAACIGKHGDRVRNIVRELNNEKLDIVLYSDDPEIYVREALKPAEPSTLDVDDDAHTVYVTVPEDKLSLAIGRAGQNVRLATKLTGWKISITADEEVVSEESNEEQFESKRERMIHALARDLNVTHVVAEKMFDNGFHSPEGVLYAESAYFASATGLDEVTVQDIYRAAQAAVDAKGE